MLACEMIINVFFRGRREIRGRRKNPFGSSVVNLGGMQVADKTSID
jgi:hypothetical protein